GGEYPLSRGPSNTRCSLAPPTAAGPVPSSRGLGLEWVTPGLVAVLPGRAEGVAPGEGGNRVEVVGLRGVDHGDRVDAGAGADRGGLAVGGHGTAGDLERVVVRLRHDADRVRRPLGDTLGTGVLAGVQSTGLRHRE